MRLIDANILRDDFDPEDSMEYDAVGVRYIIDSAPTIDPIRAAGGCYCGECESYKDGICVMYKNSWGGPLEMGEHDFCSNCEPREAQEDG